MSLSSILTYLRLKILISFVRLLTRLLTPILPPAPDSVLKTPSRDRGRSIKIHVYNPRDAGEAARPVLLNFFGGGFAIPLHGADDAFCRFMATNSSYAVLDVEYRVAPENPFPAAVNDAEDVVKYVLSHPDEYLTSPISVCGFSSGGTLALVMASLFPRGTFQSLVGFYPSPSLVGEPGEREAPVPGRERASFWTKIFREAYIGGNDARDPRISPVFADAANFPRKMLIFTADHDVSASEMEGLAERIQREGRAEGSHVVVRRMEDCDHGFDKNKKSEKQMEAGRKAYAGVVEFLGRLETEG